ncbi:MAG: LLM class flavin-dependent oxidoreductase [Gammaproteobacteria bacterium]
MTIKNYSLLDLAPVNEGSEPADAFRNAADLARHAEGWGFTRYWLAEHHNMPGIASAATSVVVGHVAGSTKTIRVGAGGIMLPNHSPLVIAEQFGTLESLYPGRIDLGLGRAPGSDMVTARALRRNLESNPDNFFQDLGELQAFFSPPGESQRVQAVPGSGLEIPIWILGSSMFGSQVAAALGLPFAFASHFAPDSMLGAIQTYRAHFKPSRNLAEPHVMVGVNFFAAETDIEAQRLFTSLQKQFTNLFRGSPGKLQPPVDSMDAYWNTAERAGVERALLHSVVGSSSTVSEKLEEFIELTGADELMLTGQIYEHKARLTSFEIASQVCSKLIH